MAFSVSRGVQSPICEWPASMYNNKKRKWTYGTLSIQAEELQFKTGDGDSSELVLKVLFSDIADFKKATTGMVFGAVVVVLKNSQTLWFSSLSDREAVYEAIRHFWRSLLVNKDGRSSNASGSVQTRMGQKLLGIVKESQDTLSEAAVQLHAQGQQFDGMISTMSDLHNDLDIGETLVEDIDSWFGRWLLPKQYEHIDPIFINKSDVPEVFEYEVLLTKLETGKANTKRVGTLRLSKDGLTLLNMKMKNEYHFKWGDVSVIRVITPWEICITQYKLGKPDLCYSVVSATMVAVLKLLDKCLKYKLRYETPPEQIWGTSHEKTEGRTSTVVQKGNLGPNQQSMDQTPSRDYSTTAVASGFTRGVDQIQINQSEQTVTESEADEISRALSGLKSLALAVQKEESVQNEKLDSLIPTVERANQRLSDATRKVKRLT